MFPTAYIPHIFPPSSCHWWSRVCMLASLCLCLLRFIYFLLFSGSDASAIKRRNGNKHSQIADNLFGDQAMRYDCGWATTYYENIKAKRWRICLCYMRWLFIVPTCVYSEKIKFVLTKDERWNHVTLVTLSPAQSPTSMPIYCLAPTPKGIWLFHSFIFLFSSV